MRVRNYVFNRYRLGQTAAPAAYGVELSFARLALSQLSIARQLFQSSGGWQTPLAPKTKSMAKRRRRAGMSKKLLRTPKTPSRTQPEDGAALNGHQHPVTPSWGTAVNEAATDTAPVELAALKNQADQCKPARRRVLALNCLADAVVSFVTARRITTLVLVALLLGAAYLVF